MDGRPQATVVLFHCPLVTSQGLRRLLWDHNWRTYACPFAAFVFVVSCSTECSKRGVLHVNLDLLRHLQIPAEGIQLCRRYTVALMGFSGSCLAECAQRHTRATVYEHTSSHDS